MDTTSRGVASPRQEQGHDAPGPEAVVAPGEPAHPVDPPTVTHGAHQHGARDWAWRRRIRANPQSHHVYKWVIGGIGFVVTVAGLIMVPFPGPGWLVVFIGVSIWASEFHWARRLHTYGMARLRVWNDWVMRQGIAVRTGVFLATCAFVNAVIWVMFKLTGIPGWIPPEARAFMTAHLAL